MLRLVLLSYSLKLLPSSAERFIRAVPNALPEQHCAIFHGFGNKKPQTHLRKPEKVLFLIFPLFHFWFFNPLWSLNLKGARLEQKSLKMDWVGAMTF